MKLTGKQIFILSGFAILIFFYQFIFLPGRRQLHSLQETVMRKNRDLKLLENLCQQYQQRSGQKQNSSLKYVDNSFSLIGFIGNLTDALDLKGNVREVKPLPQLSRQEATVERLRVSMEEITLEKLCQFLKEVETRGFIYLPSFQMKRHREKPFLLNVELELTILKKAGPVSPGKVS